MDPATIGGLVSSAIQLATFCGGVAKELNTLISNYKNAKLAILAMVQGLDTMQLAWSRIAKWAQNQPPDELLEEDDFIGRLRRSLETGSLVMDALNEELLTYKPSKMGHSQRTRAVWNEGTLRSHQERIRDQASSMTLLLQAIHLPTLGDRNNLLRASETQFGKSDESAYSIVPSRMSMSIYTGHTIDSGASISEEDLVYKPLTFENELFTARVYKRSYRTPALHRLLKGTEQKTFDKTRPRTVAQEIGEDPDGSEADNLTIREPGPTQKESLINTLRRLEGPPISFSDACAQGHVELVEAFLQSGQDVNVRAFVNENLYPQDYSAIHIAAMGGHVQVVEILLSYGADKEMPSRKTRKRPLHLAVKAGHVAIVRHFLDKGTDIAASDTAGTQAIHLAAGCGSMEMLCLLLGRGAAIDSAMTNGDQPLHVASQNPDRADTIRFLSSQGADIEAHTHHGYTPLYFASLHNNVENMRALLNLGAAHSPLGPSILSKAVERGRLQAIRLLLEGGVDPNCPVDGERTALHRLMKACVGDSLSSTTCLNRLEIVKLLLGHGANVDLQDSNGDTPLHYLCNDSKLDIDYLSPRVELAKILLKSERDIDMVNHAGETALGLSIRAGSSMEFRLGQTLIDSGARLLLSKQDIKIGLHFNNYRDGHLSFVKCYLWQGSRTLVKHLSINHQSRQLQLYSFKVLQGLLRDREPRDLIDSS